MVRCLWSVHVSWIPHHTELHPSRNVYLTSWFILCVLFLTSDETSVVLTRVSDNPVTWTSTPVGMSTQPAGSFCLYCFRKMVRDLWSLDVSRSPCHTDLHPSRNINPTNQFIQSVLFLTGGEMSLVPTCIRVPTRVWDTLSHSPPP